MMKSALVWVVTFVMAVPTAAALDAFPQHVTWGAHEARVLVRLPEGGVLRVSTEPPVEVAIVPTPGDAASEFTRAPATFPVRVRLSDDSWHGLPGTVEVILRRADPRVPVIVTIEDDAGTGFEGEWAKTTRQVDGPAFGILLAAAALVAAARRGARAQGERRRHIA